MWNLSLEIIKFLIKDLAGSENNNTLDWLTRDFSKRNWLDWVNIFFLINVQDEFECILKNDETCLKLYIREFGVNPKKTGKLEIMKII